MIVFALLAALLAAAALAIAFRPALRARRAAASREALNLSVYRDQLRELEADLAAGRLACEDYDTARAEIERRVLEDVKPEEAPGRLAPKPRVRPAWAMPAVAIAVPVLAAAVYFAAGNPGALDPVKRHGDEVGMKEIEAMVQRLADRLEKNPDDVEGWKMLGKSYNVMGRFAEAATAYSRAAARDPRNPQLLADLADALAMARGQKLEGEPEELVLRALQLDPKNAKALALAGTAAYERKDYRAAAAYWERMVPLVPEDSEDRRIIESNIAEARSLAQAGPAKKKAAAAKLEGTVTLAPALAARVK
ncbi:MAG: c-type cytochrome biogenesis protein CcmI, partial [Betaproteobacteria bacterium]|nr:c-type cytochrome biogenesis protein CcmI [Betaproteobacteria bacterium]